MRFIGEGYLPDTGSQMYLYLVLDFPSKKGVGFLL